MDCSIAEADAIKHELIKPEAIKQEVIKYEAIKQRDQCPRE
jgi:hypothetical protein